MECLCERLAERMIRGGLLEADKKDWMVYILQKWAMKCSSVILFVVLLGLLIGWVNAIVFYTVTARLRAYAGGWHARKFWLCTVVSAVSALVLGLIAPMIVRCPGAVLWLTVTLSTAVLVYVAPVAPINLPFTPAERAAHRQTMWRWIAVIDMMFVACRSLCAQEISVYIAVALLYVAVLVIIEESSKRHIEF